MRRETHPHFKVWDFLELTRVKIEIGEFGTRYRFVILVRRPVKALKLWVSARRRDIFEKHANHDVTTNTEEFHKNRSMSFSKKFQKTSTLRQF